MSIGSDNTPIISPAEQPRPAEITLRPEWGPLTFDIPCLESRAINPLPPSLAPLGGRDVGPPTEAVSFSATTDGIRSAAPTFMDFDEPESPLSAEAAIKAGMVYAGGRGGTPLKVQFRVGSKPGEPQPDFTMDINGNLKPTHDPRFIKPGSQSLVVQMDDSGGAQVDNMNYIRRMEAMQAYSRLANEYNLKGMDAPPAVIPPDLPRPGPVIRRMGDNNFGPPASGGNMGGNGSFFVPPAPGDTFKGAASRNFDPGKVDWSKSDLKSLDKKNPIDQIIATIMDSNHEGARPSSVNLDVGNRKVDLGLFQANQSGELGWLLHTIVKAAPEVARRAFGDGFGAHLFQIASGNRYGEVQSLNSTALLNTLAHAVKDPAFEAVNEKAQLDCMREKIGFAQKEAAKFGIHSVRGVALVADFINQYGTKGAEKYLDAAKNVAGELPKMKAIAEFTGRGHYNRGHRNTSIIESKTLSLETMPSLNA